MDQNVDADLVLKGDYFTGRLPFQFGQLLAGDLAGVKLRPRFGQI
jgi:hypothetical protein